MHPDDITTTTEGGVRWEPGTLSTRQLRRLLVDVLSDLWTDCFRQAGGDFRRNQFRQTVAECVREATHETFSIR